MRAWPIVQPNLYVLLMNARNVDWKVSLNKQGNVVGESAQPKSQLCPAELLVSQIDCVIHRVENNQLSAGQGWREVKRMMNLYNDNLEKAKHQ